MTGENEQLRANNKELLDDIPRPDKLTQNRPTKQFETHLGLDGAGVRQTLRSNLHSFGVWTPHPEKKGAKDLVWRVQKHFGYGRAVQSNPDAEPILKKAGSL